MPGVSKRMKKRKELCQQLNEKRLKNEPTLPKFSNLFSEIVKTSVARDIDDVSNRGNKKK